MMVVGEPDMRGSRSGCILLSAARMACRHRPVRLLMAACSVGAWCCKHTQEVISALSVDAACCHSPTDSALNTSPLDTDSPACLRTAFTYSLY